MPDIDDETREAMVAAAREGARQGAREGGRKITAHSAAQRIRDHHEAKLAEQNGGGDDED